MQIQELTQNGIEKFFKGQTVILQIFNTVIECHEKHNEKVQMIRATISDGFAFFQSIYLFVDGFSNKTIQFNVIRVKLMDNIVKKLAKGNQPGKKPLLTDSNNFGVVANKINRKIGGPISFEQFMRNGKKNPKGNRKIENSKQEEEEEDTEDLMMFEQAQRLRDKIKNNKFQKPNENTKRQSQSNAYSNTNTNSNTNNTNNSNTRNNSVTNQTKLTQYPKQRTNHSTNPIQKQQNTRNQPIKRVSIKPEVNHNEGHQTIKDLFLGMQNYKIYVRLLFIWPVRVFTNKKGTQSELLNLQFGDQTGTIMCTAFGDCANRYSTLIVDRIHFISGATVTQSTYKGVTQLKLTFNESTKVGFEQKQKNLEVIKKMPTIQNFCISLRQLSEKQKGRSATVICMVKQLELVQFVSKNGNNIKKKILKLFDFQNQIECQLTTFNQNAVREYQMGMYALKGVEVDQFQGNKQFKAGMIFQARYLNNHQMNKRVNQIDQLTFASINSNQKPKKDQLSSFSMLNQKSQDLNLGETLWTQTTCYLKAIRLGGNSKNVYLSCPHCKKKILEQDATQCNHCSKDFDKPKYRYILNVNLMDDHDNIWVSAYDDAGQKVLALPTEELFSADNFAQMNEQNIKQRIQQIRYKPLKVKLVSAKEQYNNQVRVKHKIVKVLPLVYEEQNKKLLQKIKSLTGVM